MSEYPLAADSQPNSTTELAADRNVRAPAFAPPSLIHYPALRCPPSGSYPSFLEPYRHELFGSSKKERSFGDRWRGEALTAEFVSGQNFKLIRGLNNKHIALLAGEI